jgi:hypothetical protein
MNPGGLERARALILCLLLLQSLPGCAVPQGVPPGPWTRAAPMPTARSQLAAAALDGRIYVAGGIAQWETSATLRPRSLRDPPRACEVQRSTRVLIDGSRILSG